jgi:hypothetical protein
MKKQSKYSIYDTHDGNHDCPAAIFYIDLMSMLIHLNEAGSTSSIIIDLKMANCPDNHIYCIIEKMALLIVLAVPSSTL